MGWKEERLDKGTSQMTGDFLFKFPEKQDQVEPLQESLALQARTRITGPYLMSSLLMYSTIYQVLDCDYARIISNNISRLMISNQGQGRAEAVSVLSSGLPDEKIIRRGNV